MNPEDNEKHIAVQSQIDRRTALKKVGYYALSTATLMVLMQSQAKAQTSPTAPQNAPVWEGD